MAKRIRCRVQTLADLFVSATLLENGCRIWTGAKHNRYGYGHVRFNGKPQKAHRVAWVLANGPIPDGLFVCHKCDTPACIEPTCLFLGTAKDNSNDRDAKGRTRVGHQVGETNGISKLVEADVIAIRAMRACGATQREVAAIFRVSQATVSHIVTRRGWKHVA